MGHCYCQDLLDAYLARIIRIEDPQSARFWLKQVGSHIKCEYCIKKKGLLLVIDEIEDLDEIKSEEDEVA